MEAYDADELITYRSLSTLAILALVLGLLSPLALMVPLFLVIPLAGVAVALFACSSIGAHKETLSGMSLAKIALFLSVLCLLAAPMKTLVRNRLYQRQAEQAARQWLNALAEGNLSKAVEQLTPNTIRGLSTPAPSGEKPSTRQAGKPAVADIVEALGKDQFVEDLRAQAEGGSIDFKAVSMSVDNRRSPPSVAIEYLLDNKHDSSAVLIHTQRMSHQAIGKVWKIESWKQADVHAHQH